MSKEATYYFIEDWGDKRPNEVILRYDETELSMTPEDVGRTMQAYSNEWKEKAIKKLNEDIEKLRKDCNSATRAAQISGLYKAIQTLKQIENHE